ncbi:DUF934 domain-containing protein [Bermanella marisrubri]|uniref:Oxidoreductase probably involved in sulfite reduction n=1 Tax=Bermanella marisrubri TaxID=207949 RepID=Q1MXY0_9GAMM|nr:DUF934 domain-containing protein [Bermanella marisrubri]EAT10849.1 hypothetical protein RED65_07149 [Oceanobacter sp. RED65] [Bermanella marisrubri]QIZ84230.1 DUF934 domain-containing protein [Bermanella marisrubri]
MQNLINDSEVLQNDWAIIDSVDALQSASGKVIVTTDLLEDAKANSDLTVGILLNGDADLEELKDEIGNATIVAINFPAFADGRGYSLARLLKERYDYQGEIRAIGDVLIDQLHFMKRCGFDTYLLKEGLVAEEALNYFKTFSDPYQLAYDEKQPLFRRRA